MCIFFHTHGKRSTCAALHALIVCRKLDVQMRTTHLTSYSACHRYFGRLHVSAIHCIQGRGHLSECPGLAAKRPVGGAATAGRQRGSSLACHSSHGRADIHTPLATVPQVWPRETLTSVVVQQIMSCLVTNVIGQLIVIRTAAGHTPP